MDDEEDRSHKSGKKRHSSSRKGKQEPSHTAEHQAVRERPRLGWPLRWLLTLAFLGGTCLVMAPMAISWLGLTGSLITQFALPPGMSLEVGTAHLAWWSAIDIEKAHLGIEGRRT